MKKALGQTVRDIKREVNKKVLKVPSIEQKVLDATSNEPWGPHGSLLADIAQATRNYHEYQMIMSVIWKRINDTGKNWRHVYKALTVLDYLVAHGSERVIDEIREHAYQISTLSDFQYIDSSGRDQGNNVRKKSQSLVVLVNDKERIQEVRQKAAANRDKYRTASAGSMYRPGSGGYGDRYDDDRYDGQYGNRDDDRNGYGRDRDWRSRDDDRYGRYGDSYNRDGDRYGRDSEDRHSRDGSRDDDSRGRSRNIDDYRCGSRSRSADQDRDRSYEDDGQYSSRGSAARADDHSQDGGSVGKSLDRKYSEQNLGAPPSYEEAVGPARSPTYSERDGESSMAPAPKASSPTGNSPPATAVTAAPPFAPASPPAPSSTQATVQYNNHEVDGFDEFDPRGSFSAAPAASNITTQAVSNGSVPATSGNAEMDLLGSLSDSYALALVPASEPTTAAENNASANITSGPTFAAPSSASTVSNQPFDDPFGDGTFKAIPSADTVSAPTVDVLEPVHQKVAADFGGNFYNETHVPSGTSDAQPFGSNAQELLPANQDFDILADILPPSTSSSFTNTQSGYPVAPGQYVPNANFPLQVNEPVGQPGLSSQNSFIQQINQPAGFPTQPGQSPLQPSFSLQPAESAPPTSFPTQPTPVSFSVQGGQASQMGFYSQTGQPPSVAGFPSQMGSSQAGLQTPFGNQPAMPNPPNSNFYGAYHSQIISTIPGRSSSGPIAQQNFLSQSQAGPTNPLAPVSTMPASTGSTAIVPQPAKDKFETKSTVWTDTLSRGLVNLNISGPKTNPLADIGVDFDAINRKEKRMEKPTATAVTSTINMGKAMGSGSGMGRAGASALRPPPNPMMGTGMNMALGGGPGGGINLGGYGGNQPMGRGMGVGMSMPGGMGMGMGMGMNMGMNQGVNMQQQTGYPQPGGYNPMMGQGNYGQQPYGGGHR